VTLDALVLAGGKVRRGDPLFALAPDGFKALLPIGGKPMVQWVVDALAASPRVGRIVLVGLPDDAPVRQSAIAARLPDRGSLFLNIQSGAEWILRNRPAAPLVVAASGDLPAITPEMVTWVVDAACRSDYDLYYVVISKETMESSFPGSRRSFVHLRDCTLCGGDLHILRLSLLPKAGLWERMHAARKSVLRMAAWIGAGTLLRLAFRLLSLEGAQHRVSRRIGMRGCAIVSPFAELGMDIDTSRQYTMVRNTLERRGLTQTP
jgi:molybdopterin-guanine dinucleotide biosynthesis protein A